jgi:hypothetical protein
MAFGDPRNHLIASDGKRPKPSVSKRMRLGRSNAGSAHRTTAFSSALQALVFFCCWTIGQTASACIVHGGFELSNIQDADIVFEGQVVKYEYIESDGVNVDYALVSFDVTHRFFGEVNDRVTIYWSHPVQPNSMWEGPDRAIVAVQSSERQLEPIFVGTSLVSFSHRPDLPRIIDQPCSDPFILPPDDALRDALVKLMQNPTADIGGATAQLLAENPRLVPRSWSAYSQAIDSFTLAEKAYTQARLVFVNCIGESMAHCGSPPIPPTRPRWPFVKSPTRLVWPSSIEPMQYNWTMP